MREGAFLSLGAGGFHRIAYTEWGDPASADVLVCVHGLTRNGRDFDTLARSLEDRFRVVCPDMAGRGRSDWLADHAGYGYPLYCADMAALIARLGVERVDWLGTSMGGLVGMLLAAQPGAPVRRLVLNDVGPFIPRQALVRIGEYVGNAPRFESAAAADAYLRETLAPFGPLSAQQWSVLLEHSRRESADGGWVLSYDPGIAQPFRAGPIGDVDLWAAWDAIRCPVLALRGERSDLLLAETAAQMRERGPRAEVIEFPGCGHAPALMSAAQIGPVRDWLRGQI